MAMLSYARQYLDTAESDESDRVQVDNSHLPFYKRSIAQRGSLATLGQWRAQNAAQSHKKTDVRGICCSTTSAY